MSGSLGLAAGLASLLAAASVPAPGSVAELEACMVANLPSRSSVQTVSLHHVDHSGSDRTLDAKVFWKRTDEGLSRLRVQVSAPPDDRGSAYLLRENATGDPEMVIYLPELKKPKVVHVSAMAGNVFGLSFSYEDFLRIQELGSGASSERLPDAEVGGARAAVVAVVPPAPGSAYSRIVYFVEAERCVPLRIEFFDADGAPSKRLVSDPAQITREGKGWLVRSLVLEDLQNQTRTEVQVEEIEVDAAISDAVFTPPDLARKR